MSRVLLLTPDYIQLSDGREWNIPQAQRAAEGEAPPYSNTGVNLSRSRLQFERVANHGPVLLDTLTITIPLVNLGLPYSEDDETREEGVDFGHDDYDCLVIQAVGKHLLSFVSGIEVSEAVGAGKNHYKKGCALTFGDGTEPQNVGFITWGGNDGGDINKARVCINLGASGCSLIQRWGLLYQMCVALDARITRVDIAYDDHEGVRGINHALEAVEWGGFNPKSGRPPKINHIKNLQGRGGETIYVGNRQNGKMLRIYEKGIQLGEEANPWVRWELELRSQKRVVPLEVLIDPAPYLAGAYDATAFVSTLKKVIKTVIKRLAMTYDACIRNAKIQAGRTVFAMRAVGGSSDSDIVNFLIRDGLPKRLKNTPIELQPI